jgi:NADH:ubiquinone oxidoreductase subunit 5 (subunit L)/multisubunit Na+/H+ antiporter MnhA subunit
MAIILNLTWAIVLLPLVGVGAAFLAESPRRAAQTGVAFTALALALSVVVLIFRLTHVINVYENTETFWDLQATAPAATSGPVLAPEFGVFWGIRVDPLSLAFMASALFLSLVAQLHALVSMRGDAGFRRFFWVMGTLTFGVLAVVSSPNLFQLWLGWGVSGVAAWMLATHHWQRAGASAVATRTFVVLRIADLALLLGMVMTFTRFGAAVTERPATNGQVINDPFSFTQLTPEWHAGHLGAVAGVGTRSLVVIAVLFVVAAAIRAAVGPLHLWLTGALDAPVPALALIAVSALVPAGVLLARVYPLLLEAPHLLTALALLGAGGAVAGAVLALAQRDVLRIGMFAVSSQAGLMLATFGVGGFSPALFLLFTASFLTVVFFLAAGNLIRGFRSRELADCGGGRRRMPRTTLALGGWALGISGLSLNTYSALSATFHDTFPHGGHVSRTVQVLVGLAVLVTVVLTAAYAFRVYFTVASGETPRRRGFDVARLREVDPRLRRTAFLALAGAAAATIVGLPGVNSFTLGSRTVPGLTFTRFVFYGNVRQQLPFDGLALVLAVVLAAGGALAAWWFFSADHRRAVATPLRNLASAGMARADPTPAERVTAWVPQAFIASGQRLDSLEMELLEPIPDAMGESVGAVSEALTRLRTTRFGLSLAAALAVIAVLLAASILAVTGHFPVSTQ